MNTSSWNTFGQLAK